MWPIQADQSENRQKLWRIQGLLALHISASVYPLKLLCLKEPLNFSHSFLSSIKSSMNGFMCSLSFQSLTILKLKKHKRRVYDFIISLHTQSHREGPRLAPKLLESIVIQQKPEGRELIISRFSGIIEQMCFEIGQLTIAMPVVISSHTAVLCNAETESEERESEEGLLNSFS